MSDTHNRILQITIPKCDVLVISGDLTMMGSDKELDAFDDDIRCIKMTTGCAVVAIAGNHDWGFWRNRKKARNLISNVDHYLQDEEVVIDGVKFYGSPWQPEFFDWAFNLPRGKELKDKWDMIPSDVDVLITHGPPYKILDNTTRGERVGCEELLQAVLEKKPRYHVFGHIHGQYGQKQFQETQFINASTCNERYQAVNPPIVFDVYPRE